MSHALDLIAHAGRTAGTMDSDDELGLGDLMPVRISGPESADAQREPSPPPPEATYSTYPLPEGYGPDELQIRLVGSHPLWGHHLCVSASQPSARHS